MCTPDTLFLVSRGESPLQSSVSLSSKCNCSLCKMAIFSFHMQNHLHYVVIEKWHYWTCKKKKKSTKSCDNFEYFKTVFSHFFFFVCLFVMKFCLLVYIHSCPAETPSTEIFASVWCFCYLKLISIKLFMTLRRETIENKLCCKLIRKVCNFFFMSNTFLWCYLNLI